MAIIDKKQTRWYSKSTFDSLDKTTIPVGTEIQVTGEIEETDLTTDLQTKINGKLTAPTTPTADSVVTMAANGTVGTKKLGEFALTHYYNHRLYYMNASIGNAYIDIINSSDTAFTQPSEFISFIDNKVAIVIGSNAMGAAAVRFFKDDIIWLRGCGVNPSDTTASATIDMQLSTTHFVSDTVTEL